jgi:hypothetical protein
VNAGASAAAGVATFVKAVMLTWASSSKGNAMTLAATAMEANQDILRMYREDIRLTE